VNELADPKETVFAEERKQTILQLIEKNEKVTVPELSKVLNVSGATVRTYLRELEKASFLRRTHGGAMANSKASFEVNPKDKEIKNIEEKKSIAKEALNLIDDGDTIILDTGTTTLYLADILDSKKNLTVVTNDIIIAKRLENNDNINVILIGGLMKKNFHCTVGTLGLSMISNMAIDKVFMATNGISPLKGASTPEINQAEIKKSMISVSDKVIFLCDSSKIGTNYFLNFAKIQQIDTIITDRKLNDKMKNQFESQGIEIILAE
jgi:DeoR family fructose operon transcriptional repressor